MPRLSTLLFVALAAGLAPAAAQPILPAGFSMQSVVLDPFVSPPSAFAFLPDGRILLTEKDTGHVRLATVGDPTSSIILTIPDVTHDSERGLLGIAVDPDWPARPYVYCHSTRLGDVIHITLYAATGDLMNPTSSNLTLGTPYTLLSEIPDRDSIHNGGTLRFGRDGNLYVSVGDDATPCEAQVTNGPRGKILRLDVSRVPTAAVGPPPLEVLVPIENGVVVGERRRVGARGVRGGPGEWDRLVYAHGLRNPFRFTIDPRTGNLYIGDVGHATWEEVDELVEFGVMGSNFGWPEWEGTLLHPIPEATDCSVPPFVAPIHLYPNPSGAGGLAAVVCGPRYRTDPHAPFAFPAAYDGDVFLADFYGGWIERITSDGTTWSVADSVAGQPSALHWGANLGLIVDLQQGPDGALYVLCYGNGGAARGLHRIVNTLPSATGGLPGNDALRLCSVPNPAQRGAGVWLEYQLGGRADRASLRIYDASGRLVQTWAQPAAAAGSVHWDGRARDGSRVAAGIYLLELRTASGERRQSRIVLVR